MLSCPMLPKSADVQQTLCRKAESELEILMTQPTTAMSKAIEEALANLHEQNKRRVCWSVLVGLLKVAITQWNDDYFRYFVNLLKVCPGAARIADTHGYLLIHHLLIIDDFPPQLLRCVIAAYPPASVSFFTHPDGRVCSPVHYILLKPQMDLDSLLWMLMLYPACSKCEMEGGKLPLHLVLQYVPNNDLTDKIHCQVIKKLLAIHPKAVHKAVVEERRRFQFNPRIGEFTFIAEKVSWCPLSKSEELGNHQIHNLMIHALEKQAMLHMQSQWKRV